MNQKKLPNSILFISKNKFELYSPDKNNVFPFEFEAKIIKDSEILDREKLYTQIKNFIDTNKISPTSLIIILAKNAIFEKDFPKEQNTADQQQIKIQQYLENVPFESVGSKIIPLEKGFKVVAANADLYDTIKGIFLQTGFGFECILPASLFGQNIESLNAESIKTIFQKTSLLKKHSLETESSSIITANRDDKVKKKKNLTLIISSILMFIVAGALIVYALFFLK